MEYNNPAQLTGIRTWVSNEIHSSTGWLSRVCRSRPNVAEDRTKAAIVYYQCRVCKNASGTKPYMAPEIYSCVIEECGGYSFPVDWWSLGIVAYELLAGSRPYDIHSTTTMADVRELFAEPLIYPPSWSPDFVELMSRLLQVQPESRLTSERQLRELRCLSHLYCSDIFSKRIKPPFCPPRDRLNCDPTFELEEMIIESRPLHKKKKRLAKQRSLRETQTTSIDTDCPLERDLDHLENFSVYNRERDLALRARETAWEAELQESMRASDKTQLSHLEQRLSQHKRNVGFRLSPSKESNIEYIDA